MLELLWALNDNPQTFSNRWQKLEGLMGQASASFTGAGSAFKASLTRQARELKLCLWLKQLGGHLFVPAGPVACCGGTTTPGHIGQLPRQASGYHASELFGGLETDSRSMISPSPSAWQTFADLLDPA